MCRLAAFPPGTTQDVALEMMLNFAKSNPEGAGSAYVKDGKHIVARFPGTLADGIKAGVKFFDHMPYDGWTIAHVRQATHGEVAIENTHPFVKGEWAFAHNGVFSSSESMRVALLGLVKFEGGTDSEVLAYLLDREGVERFSRLITGGGVYMGLSAKTGAVTVVKTSGELSVKKMPENKALIASSFGYNEHDGILETGFSGILTTSAKGEIKKASTLRLSPKVFYSYQNQQRVFHGGEDEWPTCYAPPTSSESSTSSNSGTMGRGPSLITTAIEDVKKLKRGQSLNLWKFDPDALMEGQISPR